MVMQAPAKFYEEQRIPIVRWMYPGKAYKARLIKGCLIKVPRKYNEAVLYIYVLNEQHVIAYRDEAMKRELGRFRLEHFEKIKEIPVEEPPSYSWVMLRPVTIGMLLDAPKHVDSEIKVETVSETPEIVTQEAESVTEKPVIVTITPPEPAVQYEQLALF